MIDHHGDLRAVFPHDTEPLLPQVLEAIEEVLADLPRSVQPEDGQRQIENEGEEDSDEEERPPTTTPGATGSQSSKD